MDSTIAVTRPPYMTPDLVRFSARVDDFLVAHCLPRLEQWRRDRAVDRESWRLAGEAGLLMVSAPVEFGGGGGTMAHEAVITERFGAHGCDEFMVPVQNLGFGPYIVNFASDEQKRRWIPKLASGEFVGAIGMTEPNAGSDLAAIRTVAVRDGDGWLINGSKIFTTHGSYADIIMIAAKTDPAAGRSGISLFIVETKDRKGFVRGKLLEPIGCRAHGTCELFFDDMRVPGDALLGTEAGLGFEQLMSNLVAERLIGIVQGSAMMESVLNETLARLRLDPDPGAATIDDRVARLVLADCKTEATVGKILAQHCVQRILDGQLDAVSAAMAKLWLSEAVGRTADRCLQLVGAEGWFDDGPVSHAYLDSRVSRIGGGTSEIMRLIISRSI